MSECMTQRAKIDFNNKVMIAIDKEVFKKLQDYAKRKNLKSNEEVMCKLLNDSNFLPP